MAFLMLASGSLQAGTPSPYQGTYTGTVTVIGPGSVPQVWTLIYKASSVGTITSGKLSFGATTLNLVGKIGKDGETTMVSIQTNKIQKFAFAAGAISNKALGSTTILMWNIANNQPKSSTTLPRTQAGTLATTKS